MVATGRDVAVYSVCSECGFVLRAASVVDAQPMHWEECPSCGGEDFEFADDEPFSA